MGQQSISLCGRPSRVPVTGAQKGGGVRESGRPSRVPVTGAQKGGGVRERGSNDPPTKALR